MRLRERLDEVRTDAVHLYVLQRQPLPAQATPLGGLHDLDLVEHACDEGCEVIHLRRGLCVADEEQL